MSLARYREQEPLARDSLEGCGASVLEADSRTSNEVFDNAGHENLVGLCPGGHSGGNVYGQSGYVATTSLGFAGVDASP